MKLQHGGIHKNVGFIVQHCGGYDREYHITKVAEKLNIDRDTIKMLFRESSVSNREHYIQLLEQGVSIEKVFKMIDADNRLSEAKFRALSTTMLRLASKSIYGNLF